ncbi:MAG: UPF0158 family protein [Chloroflexi bacterium]|nr:UPF0158 family protein [Chloroflexota bacterium]
MRQCNVNLSDLVFAFESSFESMDNYLDLETGQVVAISDDTRRELDRLYEEMDVEEQEEPPPLAQLLDDRNLPDWQRQEIERADQVEREYGSRFIAAPQMDSHEGYREMEDFIATARDDHVRELLEVAIMGRGAFRRFKDVLLSYPRERWFKFRDEKMFDRVYEWLEEHDIQTQ